MGRNAFGKSALPRDEQEVLVGEGRGEGVGMVSPPRMERAAEELERGLPSPSRRAKLERSASWSAPNNND